VANEERGDVSKTANKKTFTAVAKPNATASLDQSSGQAAVESRGNAPQTDNLASVVYASPQSTGSFYKWLIPTIGFGLLVATGYIYSKRQKPTSEPVTEEVEEFTLDDPSDRDF
jgi:hypothetical protein